MIAEAPGENRPPTPEEVAAFVADKDPKVAAGYRAIEFVRVGTQVDRSGKPIEDTGFLAPVVLAERLLQLFGRSGRVFYANPGAEANEAAFKLARKWGQHHRNGAFEIISANNSFHGRTLMAVSALVGWVGKAIRRGL